MYGISPSQGFLMMIILGVYSLTLIIVAVLSLKWLIKYIMLFGKINELSKIKGANPLHARDYKSTKTIILIPVKIFVYSVIMAVIISFVSQPQSFLRQAANSFIFLMVVIDLWVFSKDGQKISKDVLDIYSLQSPDINYKRIKGIYFLPISLYFVLPVVFFTLALWVLFGVLGR